MVSLVPLLLVVVISYSYIHRSLEETARQELVERNQISAQNVQNLLNQFVGDVRSFSDLPAIYGLIRAMEHNGTDPQTELTYEQWVANLQQIFEAQLKAKEFYQQLRYLDETGQERVRVDFRDSTAIIVPTSDLQDKSNRDYFIEASELPPDQLYISALNLNQEHGEIEKPHTPVIRYAIPIFDEADRYRGIVIANIYADYILSQFKQYNLTSDLYLINQDGYYLWHPNDPNYETITFGFDLEHGITATPDFGWLLTQLGDDTLFEGEDPQTGLNLALQKISFDPHSPNRHWVLIRVMTELEVLTDINKLANFIVSMAMLLSLLVIIVSVWLAGTITNPIARLALVSKKLAQGEWDTPIPTNDGEIGELADSLQNMVAQLKEFVETLEARIRIRTEKMETSAEISRQLTTMLDLEELLAFVVERIGVQFNFYHVHVYLMNDSTDKLVMVEGVGDVGQQLKAQRHTLKFGQGIVGQVARTGQAIRARNVEAIPNFFPNPLLPNTKSEMAVPLRKGHLVLGVLDIQSNKIDDFSESEQQFIQSIADQLAVAVDNARLFKRTETALVAVEALNRQLTRQAWKRIETKTDSTGYIATQAGVVKDNTAWLPSMDRAMQQRDLVTPTASSATEVTSLAIPLMLRDEIIGVLGIERATQAPWRDNELVTIRAVAEQIALALDAARLARETQRRAAREEIIANLTQTVWSASDIEGVLQKSVGQLGQTFRASKVVLQLGHQNFDENS